MELSSLSSDQNVFVCVCECVWQNHAMAGWERTYLEFIVRLMALTSNRMQRRLNELYHRWGPMCFLCVTHFCACPSSFVYSSGQFIFQWTILRSKFSVSRSPHTAWHMTLDVTRSLFTDHSLLIVARHSLRFSDLVRFSDFKEERNRLNVMLLALFIQNDESIAGSHILNSNAWCAFERAHVKLFILCLLDHELEWTQPVQTDLRWDSDRR